MTETAPDEHADGPPGGRDPRRMVTPYAFEVADRLMGLPLATPWRRAAAMLVDLAAVGGLALLREITGPLFLLLLAWFAYRATTDRARHPVRATLPRLGMRAAAAVLLLVGGAQGIDRSVDALTAGDEPPGSGSAGPAGSADSAAPPLPSAAGGAAGLTDLGRTFGRMSDLRSGDSARVEKAARELAEDLLAAGVTPRETREVLLAAGAPNPDSTLRRAADRAVSGLDSAASAFADSSRGPRADSLARAWAAALEAGDSAAAAEARREMTGVLAADSVRELERGSALLSARLSRLSERLEEAEDPPSLLDYVEGLARDLGLGFGWFGLYFTAFLALWKGRTPGKRLLGIRVVKVNGEPIGWWDAFSRFGGYAASVVTGLIGFLQVTWDANRQGLHDRIAGTVVIRGDAPAPEEGAAGRADETEDSDGPGPRAEGTAR